PCELCHLCCIDLVHKRSCLTKTRLQLAIYFGLHRGQFARKHCKVASLLKQRRLSAASGRCGARKLESTNWIARISWNGWMTCRQSQKRDGKIPEATKLRRYLLHRIPLNQMNSKELSVWKQPGYELCND